MSEIAKCPCCGESISEFEDSGFWECDNCPFMCALSDLPRIAAAMELARATVVLENAMEPLNSGKLKMGGGPAYNQVCDGGSESVRKARYRGVQMSVKRYVLDENTLMGGMDMFEDDNGDYVLCSDYAAIEEERDKLAREVMRLVNINEQLHERHNALREAVAWERECAEFDKWANDNCQGSYEWDNVVYCATLEVDRLIGEGK